MSMHAYELLLLFSKAVHIAQGRPALPTYLQVCVGVYADATFARHQPPPPFPRLGPQHPLARDLPSLLPLSRCVDLFRRRPPLPLPRSCLFRAAVFPLITPPQPPSLGFLAGDNGPPSALLAYPPPSPRPSPLPHLSSSLLRMWCPTWKGGCPVYPSFVH